MKLYWCDADDVLLQSRFQVGVKARTAKTFVYVRRRTRGLQIIAVSACCVANVPVLFLVSAQICLIESLASEYALINMDSYVLNISCSP